MAIKLVSTVINEKKQWTLIAVSNDPMVMAACDRVILLESGVIAAEGTFTEMVHQKKLLEFIY